MVTAVTVNDSVLILVYAADLYMGVFLPDAHITGKV